MSTRTLRASLSPRSGLPISRIVSKDFMRKPFESAREDDSSDIPSPLHNLGHFLVELCSGDEETSPLLRTRFVQYPISRGDAHLFHVQPANGNCGLVTLVLFQAFSRNLARKLHANVVYALVRARDIVVLRVALAIRAQPCQCTLL